ncbi:helix-hairpin-helix domain-containing protein [soil metagenome]
MNISSLKYLYSLLFGLCLSFGFSIHVHSQDSESNRQQVERAIERVIADLDPEDSERQIIQLVEMLEDLASNPLNINRAGIDQLAGIPGLSFRQAQSIIYYRENIKPFEQLEELQQAEGIGAVTFEQIKPFLSVGGRLERGRDLYFSRRYWTSNSRTEALSRVQTVIEEREGYSRPDTLGGYTGSPLKFNHRYRYRSDRLSLNLTQDKDPGEPVNGITGFDYTSWHFSVNETGLLQNLVIGDYRVSYGQGLILWNGGAFGKSSQVLGSAARNDPGIRPYTSSQETNAFRGVAATIGRDLQISGFYSDRKRTASEADEHSVRFPTQTALHRTLNERDRRLNLGQETYGGRIRYQFNRGIVGASGFRNSFDRPVARGTQSYQIYQFEGQHLAAYSFDYRFSAGPVLLFGEGARTAKGGTGIISGTELRMMSGTDLAVAYRNYSADFQSIFGSGFGEQSSTQNEEGLYIGLQQSVGENILIRSYMDQFKTHSARFRNHRPTAGYDWLARLEYFPNGGLNLYAQYRFKKQEQEVDYIDNFGRSIRQMSYSLRSNARFQAEYQVLPSVRLRTRLDFVKAQETIADPSYGMLLFQDFRFTPSSELTIDFRITLFDTDDFNSRVFQFENDLLYVMSNAMLFDQGQRTYVVVRYQPASKVSIRMKAATTVYENRTTIGSGLDEIQGNRRSDIGLQIRLQI